MLEPLKPGDIISALRSELIIIIRSSRRAGYTREWAFIDSMTWIPLGNDSYIREIGKLLPNNKVVQLRLEGRIPSEAYDEWRKYHGGS